MPVIWFVLLMLFALSLVSRGQQPMKCPVDDADSKEPAYKIGLAAHSTKSDGHLYLYISVDPTHFTRKDMQALAQRLNRDFCFEKKLTAILLDDYYAARHPLRNTKSYWDAERGIYHFDRNKGRGYIKFSTARGKRKDEIVIDLNFKGR